MVSARLGGRIRRTDWPDCSSTAPCPVKKHQHFCASINFFAVKPQPATPPPFWWGSISYRLRDVSEYGQPVYATSCLVNRSSKQARRRVIGVSHERSNVQYKYICARSIT